MNLYYFAIIVITLVGFSALAWMLLAPIWRFLDREEEVSQEWTKEALARRRRQQQQRNGSSGGHETRNGETRNGETRNGETRNGEARNGEAGDGAPASSGHRERPPPPDA